MAVVFAVRGNSYTARRSGGYPNGTAYNSAQISIGAGDLGSVISLTNTAVVKYLSWSGSKNTPNSRTMSFLWRFAPAYTNAPAANRALYEVNSGASGSGALMAWFHNTSAAIICSIKNQAGANVFASQNFGTWNGTSGTYYDHVFKWDGTTTANAASYTIDNGVATTATASAALDAAWDQYYWKSLAIGAISGVTVSAMTLSEFVIWDELIDTSAVALQDGTTGALNGASRTSYVLAPAFDGSASSNAILKTQVGARHGW